MAKKKNAFNTVTPLSKAIAMILFILLPFLGFYLGVKYQKLVNPPPTISSNIRDAISYQIPNGWSELGTTSTTSIQLQSPDYLPPNLSEFFKQGAVINVWTSAITPNSLLKNNILALANPEFQMQNLQVYKPIANHESFKLVTCYKNSSCVENYFLQDAGKMYRINFQCIGINCTNDKKYTLPRDEFLSSLEFRQ